MNKQRAVFAHNLKELLNTKKMSQAELERRLGLGSGLISKWMKGTAYPKLDTIQKVADFFDIPTSSLTQEQRFRDFDEITSIYSELNQSNRRDVVNYAQEKLDEQEHPRVPTKVVPMAGYSAAGTEAEPYCADTTGEEAETNKVKADAFVILTGDSMEPRFKKDEMVFYKSQPNIENGEFAIVEIDGDGAICKQVKIDYDNRKIILHSLNPKYDDIIVDPTQIRILGKVID